MTPANVNNFSALTPKTNTMKYIVLIIAIALSMALSSCTSRTGQRRLDAEKAKVQQLQQELDKLRMQSLPVASCKYEGSKGIAHRHSCEQ